MYTFTVWYKDGAHFSFQHVTGARVYGSDKYKDIPENEMLTHNFGMQGLLFLKAASGNCTIKCEDLRYIVVDAES